MSSETEDSLSQKEHGQPSNPSSKNNRFSVLIEMSETVKPFAWYNNYTGKTEYYNSHSKDNTFNNQPSNPHPKDNPFSD